MRSDIDKRLKALEEATRPRMIATLADLVPWSVKGGDEEVELSPEMQKALAAFVERRS